MVCNDPPLSETTIDSSIKPAYCLRQADSLASKSAGSMVLLPSSPCPPLEWCENQNPFQHLFGVEFHYDGHTNVRPISLFEFAQCFNLSDNLQYRLSHADYKFALDASMSALTLLWLFTQINDTLELLGALNTEIFTPNQGPAPAATIQTLLNGAVCTKMHSHSQWTQAYNNNADMKAIKHLVLNPSLSATIH
jgi:hypothetical protein